MIVNQIAFTLMGVIDMIMVGQLGVVALAAVGLAAMVVMVIFAFVHGMLSSVNTLVAQAEGAREPRAAGVAVWQGLHLAAICTAGLAACWPVAPTLFSWTGASPEVQALGADYMQVRLLGGFGVTLIAVVSNFYFGTRVLPTPK